MWTAHYLDDNPMGEYTCPIYCGVNHKHFNDHEGLEEDIPFEQNELLYCQDTQKTQQ